MFTLPTALTAALAGNQFLQGGAILGAVGLAAAYARRIPKLCYAAFIKYCTYSVEVDNRSRAYEWMKLWMEQQDFNDRARHMVANIVYRNDEDTPHGRNKPKIVFTPAPGTHWVWRDYALMTVTLKKEKMGQEGGGEGGAPGGPAGGGQVAGFHESIVIRSYFGRAKEPLLGLVREAQKISQEVGKDSVKIYSKSHYSGWSLLTMKPKRKRESVIMDQNTLEDMISDVKKFQSEKDWYQERGIPWKRGYLLHGPPGNGKSTVILTLASELNADIYYLNLAESTISDLNLISMLAEIPAGSIIAFEEIDTVFKGREAQGNKKNQTGGITFGGLLNALDGLTAQEGRIVCMTTNHREHLDAALIRPGRCDMQIEVGNASRDQIAKMFVRFFPEREYDASYFAEKFPENLVSMASLQEFFMTYRNNPDKALLNTHVLIEAAYKTQEEAAAAEAKRLEDAKPAPATKSEDN